MYATARMQCVQEGLSLGWSRGQISEAYGIPMGTVCSYAWLALDPEHYEEHKERLKRRRARHRAERGPWLYKHDGGHLGWTDAEIATLKEMVATHSMSQIGFALGRSRNSVAGKISRLREKGEWPHGIGE